ncbi:AbaSI family restriction endonuclease [Adlercreutzia sp. ZJ242]|uniref:AbaSI family restriction endonuclease n=1 Tax=Adlercreutzia sp. ZJ242 TaxID=2709409 RepID=UPI0013EACC19|nr:restriction endonuclease [Adlercreutzia sp. ZJ242]
MDKLAYLAKTLSRTKRKDYENYVVNAVWNRLACPELKPVSQQYFRDSEASEERKNRGYFIDLFFPQINMGVECQERFHERTVEHDKVRELTLIDILRRIDDSSKYKPLYVNISDGYEAVERQIDECVRTLREEFSRLKESGDLEPWETNPDPRDYLKGKRSIRADDDIAFRTIVDACNSVLKTNYRQMQRCFFKPRGADDALNGNDFRVWFPKLAINGRSVARGWVNLIDSEGNDSPEVMNDLPAEESFQRITFARAIDPITKEAGYRFVGIFELKDKIEQDGRMFRRYVRIAKELPLREA